MQEKLSNDDVLFDRLVDGELSSAERRRLLASLDESPDGWRRCALAFLEAQFWAEDFGRFVGVSDNAAVADAKVMLADARLQTAAHRPSPRRGVAWLAIAATMLAALTIALLSRDGRDRFAQDSGAQIADVVPPPTANGQKVDDALTLWVRDETGRTRPLRVPLVDAQSLDQQLGVQFRTGVPDDIRNQLRDRGFDVQSKRRYAPFWLENGRPMILPVEDTKIVPVGRNVY
jgi:hypothetical protein